MRFCPIPTLAVFAIANLGCLEATQITFDISTDVPCESISQTSITVGAEGTTERGDPSAVTMSCRSNGTLAAVGTYAVTPGKAADVIVSAKIVVAIADGLNVITDCTPDKGYRGCIVARRRLGFVKHRALRVPIEMLLSCKDVQCDPNSTCDRSGRCVSNEVNLEKCPNNTCSEFVPPRNGGLACFGDKASPLFCGGETGWCTENGAGGWGCSSETEGNGLAFSCRDANDCGPNLFCVSGSGRILGHCVVTPGPTDMVLCRPESAGAFCPMPRTCTIDAGAGLLGCSAPDAGPQVQESRGNNTEPGDQFGKSVALSDDGKTMAVGAWAEQANVSGINGDGSNNANVETGAAYVYVMGYGGWTQQAYVKPSNPKYRQNFGTSIALSGDGNTLAVGSPGEASNATGIDGDQTDISATASGAVYVFKRTGTTWVQTAFVKASNTWGSSHFGEAVTLSHDGTTLAVGARDESSASMGINGDQTNGAFTSAGAVYVFVLTGGTWSQQAYIKASNTAPMNIFGSAVSLSSDGNTLAISAMGDDVTVWNDGAFFVFSRSGTTWSQQAYVRHPEPTRDDYFASGLALSGDGNVIVAGCPNKTATQSHEGAAYVFERDGSTWSLRSKLMASNAGSSDQFGWSVAISRDGSVIASGALHEESNASGLNGDQTDNSLMSGAAYVFKRAGNSWAQQHYVKATPPGLGDSFGNALALNADGSNLLVGAPLHASGAGAAYWYRIP